LQLSFTCFNGQVNSGEKREQSECKETNCERKWSKPGTKEAARDSAVLAANQGLYNGFLAAGLLWGVFYQWPLSALHIKTFFLGCVIVAGVFGAVTVSRKILWVQALPAAIALVLMHLPR